MFYPFYCGHLKRIPNIDSPSPSWKIHTPHFFGVIAYEKKNSIVAKWLWLKIINPQNGWFSYKNMIISVGHWYHNFEPWLNCYIIITHVCDYLEVHPMFVVHTE